MLDYDTVSVANALGEGSSGCGGEAGVAVLCLLGLWASVCLRGAGKDTP